MDPPTELFRPDTLLTLSGSATAVWLVTSVLGYLVGARAQQVKKWIGLAVALLLALLGATQLEARSPVVWTAAVVNALLIYLTAVGANTILATVPARDAGAKTGRAGVTATLRRGGFRESWW